MLVKARGRRLRLGDEVMRMYQLYLVDADDQIEDAIAVISCSNDEEAVRKVERLTDRHDIEIWDGGAFIRRCCSSRSGSLSSIYDSQRAIQNDHTLVTLDS